MPVMEGKCVLFKAFGDVDAFPLCVKTHDVDEFVNAVALISGSFGGMEYHGNPDEEPQGVITLDGSTSFGSLVIEYI